MFLITLQGGTKMDDILYSLEHLHKIPVNDLKAVKEHWSGCRNLRIGEHLSLEGYRQIHVNVCFAIQNGKQVEKLDLDAPFLALADHDSEWVIYLVNYDE